MSENIVAVQLIFLKKQTLNSKYDCIKTPFNLFCATFKSIKITANYLPVAFLTGGAFPEPLSLI